MVIYSGFTHCKWWLLEGNIGDKWYLRNNQWNKLEENAPDPSGTKTHWGDSRWFFLKVYPVVNGGSDKRSGWGTHIIIFHIYIYIDSLWTMGSVFLATNRVSKPSDSVWNSLHPRHMYHIPNIITYTMYDHIYHI